MDFNLLNRAEFNDIANQYILLLRSAETLKEFIISEHGPYVKYGYDEKIGDFVHIAQDGPNNSWNVQYLNEEYPDETIAFPAEWLWDKDAFNQRTQELATEHEQSKLNNLRYKLKSDQDRMIAIQESMIRIKQEIAIEEKAIASRIVGMPVKSL